MIYRRRWIVCCCLSTRVVKVIFRQFFNIKIFPLSFSLPESTRSSCHILRKAVSMQTSEEGVQQTELKSTPGNNPFRNPSQQPVRPPPQKQATAIYPAQYSSASIEEGSVGCGDSVDQGDCFQSWEGFKSWMIRWRGSRRLVLVIVAIALLLDNMLLTVVGEFFLLHVFFLRATSSPLTFL